MAETIRLLAHFLAALLIATLPAALLFWLLVHPLAALWRRLGKGVSYLIVGLVCIAVALLLFRARGSLLAAHWGFHWPLLLIGATLYLVAAFGEHVIRRRLTFRILTGVPELDAESPGELLTDGPFSRCRNPRYVNVIVAMVGWALILNYPILYLVVALSIPLVYLVVLLEERELRKRFGAEYEAYCRRVPRFLPRHGWYF